MLSSAFAALPAAAESFLSLNDEQLRVIQTEMAVSYTNNKLLEDQVTVDYLQELAQLLSPEVRIYLVVADDETPNAFANWGNVIIINSGLIPFAGSEEGLLGVIAHEIAHVELGHFTRLDENLDVVRLLTTGTLLVALLSNSKSAPELVTGAAGISKSQEFLLRRRYEREADRKAVQHILAAGVDPKQYLDVIVRLSQGNKLPEYSSTHPFGPERAAIIKTERRSANLAGLKNSNDGFSFWLVRERIIEDLANTYSDQAPESFRPLVRAYGKLLRGAVLDQSDHEALAPFASHWIVAQALAQREVEQGNPEEAVNILENSISIWPDKPSLREELLRVLALSGKKQDFLYHLASIPSELRFSAAIAELEAGVWKQADDEFRYRVAVAYARYYEGYFAAAQTQVAEAYKLPGARENSSYSGRLAALEKKITELMRRY